MSKPQINYSIYLVTDDACLQGRPLLQCVEEALQGGVTLVQYRSKHKDSGSMYEEAIKLKKLCDKYSVPLIINDRVDLALAVGAAGVHIGQSDLPCAAVRKIVSKDFIIGVSAHNVEEALQSVAAGADYLGCGAVFGTATKKDASTLGLENLRKIRCAIKLPIVGIGGVNAENYSQILKTGADGAAIISGILGTNNIKATTEKFTKIYKQHQKH